MRVCNKTMETSYKYGGFLGPSYNIKIHGSFLGTSCITLIDGSLISHYLLYLALKKATK